MKRPLFLAAVLLAALLLVSCAPGPNPEVGESGGAGFWSGLWHGFIILFTFVISLFRDDVTIYEVANNGSWYNFGYLLGVMLFWGGGGGGTAAGRRGR
ncbi:MAG: hypothetical protein Kow00129_14520 [Thermoleophilia bacterium]